MTFYTKLFGVLAIFGSGLDIADTKPSEADYGRNCLAIAAFAEARSEGEAGMLAVMQVVLNRATDPRHRWPQDICGVVMQPRQFEGVERWHYPRVPKPTESAAWLRALALADESIAGRRPLTMACDGATSFDRGGARSGLRLVCKLGVHSFYTEPRQSVAAR